MICAALRAGGWRRLVVGRWFRRSRWRSGEVNVLVTVVGRVEVVVDKSELLEELGAHRTLDVFGWREAEVNLKY